MIVVAAAASLLCWVLSLVTGDTSWVDRAWSVVPVVYTWIFAVAAIAGGAEAGRVVLLAVLVTAWGARLTFNFARKGGYTGTEDYRWAILRGRMRPWQFQVFNLLFIIGFQMALLVLITLPAEVALRHPAPLTAWDAVLAVLFLAALCGETIADQQQWAFHRRKARAGGTLEPGFQTEGLFRYSRHPNFFFEQAQWWIVYLFGAVAAVASGAGIWGGALNPSIAGAVLLSALFIGSTVFTESISAAKYPAYADYRRSTSMLVPWPPRRRSRQRPERRSDSGSPRRPTRASTSRKSSCFRCGEASSRQLRGAATVGRALPRSEYGTTVVLLERFWLQSMNTLPARSARAIEATTSSGWADSSERASSCAISVASSDVFDPSRGA